MAVIVWEVEYEFRIDDDDHWDKESQSVLGGDDALTSIMAVRESILGRKISGILPPDSDDESGELYEYRLTDFRLLGVRKITEIDHVVIQPPMGILADLEENDAE